MSPLTKAKPVAVKKSYTQYILPIYVVVSAVFILFIAYSYFQSVVYNSGTLLWQQQWYQAAYTEVINAVSQTCEAIELNVWETKVSVINITCLDTTSPSSESLWDSQ